MPRCSTFISEIFSSSKFHFIGESRIYFGFKKARGKNRVTLMKIGQNPPIFFVIESAEEKIRIYD